MLKYFEKQDLALLAGVGFIIQGIGVGILQKVLGLDPFLAGYATLIGTVFAWDKMISGMSLKKPL